MSPTSPARADLVLTGGHVYTVDAAARWAQAVAVAGGRIVAVGSAADIWPWIGPRTEVVSLRGRMVVPGFQDAHAHPVFAGLEMLRCNLAELSTRGEYLNAVGSYAAERTEAGWITGGGWTMSAFPGGTPSAADLDAIVADRPVYLPNRDHHGAWVNTAALSLAGITADTPDPADGRIERDAAGRPTGMLHEGAMHLVDRYLPEPSQAEQIEALLTAQRHLHSLGVTGWQDAILGNYAGSPDVLEAYLTAAAGDLLTARVVGCLWWHRDRGVEQIDELIATRARAHVGRFTASSVKIMQDGVCENFTASVLTPYYDENGDPTANRGLSFIDADALKEYLRRLDAADFQVHVHAIGERGVREALDAIAAARAANGMRDNRHHIAHIQIVHPDDRPRFRELSVIANAQPLWAMNDAAMTELTIPFLGAARAGWQYPFGSLERAGAQIAIGSDWPVSSPDPLLLLHVAVNRASWETGPDVPAAEREVFLGAERLTLASAIRAATMGSAYVNHLDAVTGSIEVGKLADLAVLDRNIVAAPPSEIGQARVDLTFVEGECVFGG